MANPYRSPTEFLEWMPDRYIAELSDDAGGMEPDSDKVQKALDDAAEEFESGAMVRDDIPIPTLNGDNSVPKRIIAFMDHVALYNLFSRRGTMKDVVRENFDIQMTWLDQIVRRQKNIKVVDSNNDEITETTELPRTDSGKKRKFDNFTF